MAAAWQIISRGGRIATTVVRKQISNTSSSSTSASLIISSRRGVHTSVYDKNLDDQLRPTVLPDAVIESQSDKYWAPHPHTGVFGPVATDQTAAAAAAAERTYHTISAAGTDTVLEQQAWFRPLEDVEKPRQP